jgi:sugar phosphate isomerase/epimerase
MKLGLESFSTRNSGLDPVGVLAYAAELKLSGVLFEDSPFRSYRDDDLKRIRHAAEEKGLYVEFGMGSILHGHPMAEKGRRLLAEAGYDTNVSEAQIVIHNLQVAKKLGSPLLRCVVGNFLSRDEGHDMVAMADRAVAIFREACRAAEDLGLKIAVETHADFTVREHASIVARVNSPAYGFTVDTGNLAFDLDNPYRLAEIVAPRAWTTHYKNYRFIRTRDGLALENCPLDEGEIDVAAIAEVLAKHNPDINLNIEIHEQYAPFRQDILRPAYWANHQPPPGDGLAWYLEKAWSKPPLEKLRADLPGGRETWEIEDRHVRQSARWAKSAIGHLLAN